MTGFRSKTIESGMSLGEQLRQRRIELELSLIEVSKKTKISQNYLEALEKGSYNELPGEIYARNFLKTYCNCLSLETESLLRQFKMEYSIFNKTNGVKSGRDIDRPVEKISRKGMLMTPKLIRNAVILILAVLCVMYLGSKVKAIFEPPELFVVAPVSDIVTDQKIIEVKGSADKDAIIKINGKQVLADSQGAFSEELTLSVGANIIEVTAQKKRSKIATVYRKVVIIQEDN